MIERFSQFSIDYKQPNKTLIEEIENKIRELNDFFEIKPTFSVKLLYEKEEFEFFKSRKTEKWESGFVKDNIIFVFDPEVLEKFTIHKKEEFFGTIKHEIAHVYIKNICPFLPEWLNEGIATFLGQGSKKESFKKFLEKREVLPFNIKEGRDKLILIYVQSPCFVEWLIKNYGKEKLLNFLKKIDGSHKKLSFDEIGIEFFGKKFDELRKEWLERMSS